MSEQAMIIFSYEDGKNTLTVQGRTLDEIIDAIKELNSPVLALEFYKQQYKSLNETQKRTLQRPLENECDLYNLMDFFRVDPSRATSLEMSIILAYFKETAEDHAEFIYEEPGAFFIFPQLHEIGIPEDEIEEFYKESNGECNPGELIKRIIDGKKQGHECVLIYLTMINDHYKDVVKDYLLECKSLPGIIAFSTNIERISDNEICQLALETIAKESEKERRDLHLFNAIQAIDDAEAISKLCEAFLEYSNSASYACYIAWVLSEKMEKMPNNVKKRYLQTIIKSLEDIVVNNSGDSSEYLYKFLTHANGADAKRLYREMVRLRLTNSSYGNCQNLKKAKDYVSFKDRMACWLTVFSPN
jgi:hypothetical protein